MVCGSYPDYAERKNVQAEQDVRKDALSLHFHRTNPALAITGKNRTTDNIIK